MATLNHTAPGSDPDKVNPVDVEKDMAVHLEQTDSPLANKDEWNHLRTDALAAESAEKQLSVMDSLRMYPTAVAWSVGISLCIIMEGMDLGCRSCPSLPTCIFGCLRMMH